MLRKLLCLLLGWHEMTLRFGSHRVCRHCWKVEEAPE